MNEEAKRLRPARERKPWSSPNKAESVRLRRLLDPDYRQYDILRAFVRKKRVRARADGTVTVDALRMLKAKVTCCYLCHRRIRPVDSTAFDHVVPIKYGGRHSMANLAVVHDACNRSKGAKMVALC
jgi:5-methylcytosine-specific restriction endonuclease McrA